MTFDRWVLFLCMEMALSLAPGPAVFYVVSQGVRGWPAPLRATLGILSANALYFAVSATSLGAVIAASPRFFFAAKWSGAAYLIYLGVMALRAAMKSRGIALTSGGMEQTDGGTAQTGGGTAQTGDGVAQTDDGAVQARSRRAIYRGALTLQLSNPKALLFFLALLPQFIDTQHRVGPQMVILAVTSMLPEFCILLGYGWLAQRAARASARCGVTGTMHRWLGWIEGVGLIGCATLVLNFGR